MHELEDDLKLQNWLSVLTFDVYKYAKAGGAVVIEWTDSGIAIHLTDIAPDTPGVNSKSRPVATDAPQEEAAP